jgi:flagellar basal body L-ring protein FlgH
MAKGWTGESTRHRMSAYGIKTGRKIYSVKYTLKNGMPLFDKGLIGSKREVEIYADSEKERIGDVKKVEIRENDEALEDLRKKIRKQAIEKLQKENKGHWVVQGNYGSRWEDVTEEENKFDGLNMLKDYNDNEKQYPHRLIKRRK